MKKICKCEYPYEKCDNFCECKADSLQIGDGFNIYYICPKCQKKVEEMRERMGESYQIQTQNYWR